MTITPRLPIKRNLSKLLILKGLSFAWFPIPTIMLFYQSHGLSIEQSIFLKTVLSISFFLLEIPSGYIADQWGRKFCLVFGSSIWVISWLVYCTQQTFLWFILAEFLTGVAGSLISGADTAITYDTFLQLNRAHEYRKFESKLVAISGISEAVCGLIGAIVAQYNLVYPFYLQTVCILLYCLLAIKLIEPQHEVKENYQIKVKLISIVKNALIINHSIRWLIFLSATFSVATFLIVWLSQAYLSNYNVPTTFFGIIWVVFHGLMSCASLTTSHLSEKLGLKNTLLFLIILLSGSYVFLGIIGQVWAILFVAIIYCVRGWVTPLLNEALNKLVPSSSRATIFSVKSFVFRLGFAIIGTMSGWLADQHSLNLSLTIMGITFLSFGIFSWWNLVKLKSI
ncbi:MAG: MFS transporter [Crocosphaera sp.]